MGYTVAPLERLVEQLETLPSIGHKSAGRLAFFLLRQPEEKAAAFVSAIREARENIHECSVCCNLTDKALCPVCAAADRDRSVICVVEDPQDVAALERTGEYRGLYHVLHGVISPMDGVGPDDIRIRELMERLSSGEVKEVVLATNPDVEGEATAAYISRLIKPMGVRVTRIAHGVPVGGELEYTDEVTLLRAFQGRREL